MAFLAVHEIDMWEQETDLRSGLYKLKLVKFMLPIVHHILILILEIQVFVDGFHSSASPLVCALRRGIFQPLVGAPRSV